MESNPVNRILTLIREKDLALRKLKRQYKTQSSSGYNFNAQIISMQIKQLEEEIARLKEEKDNYKRVTLKDLLPEDEVVRNNVHKQLVAISLAADYLLQEAEDFREILANLGILSADIDDEVKEVVKMANKTASRMVGTKAKQLENVLLENQELLQSLHEVTMDYINKTLEL